MYHIKQFMWHLTCERVPPDRDILFAVLHHNGFHPLEFPCHFSEGR